jgi:DNA-binding phage protein
MAQIDTNSVTFGRAFDEARSIMPITELARRIGVSRRQLYRLRDGASAPRPDTRRTIEDAVGMAVVFPTDLKESV